MQKYIEYKATQKAIQTIHFGHANGYHPDSYNLLMDLIRKDNDIVATPFMPFDINRKPSDLKVWNQIGDEIIDTVLQLNAPPVIGMGHSLGAVSSLLAYGKKPALFKKLILIEPVILPQLIYSMSSLTPVSITKKFLPVAKIALNRKDKWLSYQAAFDHFRSKSVFAKISDEGLHHHLNAGLITTEPEGVTLRYTKEWEAQVYSTVTNPWPILKKMKIPTLIIRGAETDVIIPKVWDKLKRKMPNIQFLNIPKTGHLLPFEDPQRVADAILEFI